MGQRSVPAPFLTKTYQLVDDRSSDEVISWNDGGSSFVVWKTADFAKDLLPNYFKHNNFSSFVRQLNTYGFRKVVPDKWEFANENFRRGRKELLAEIRRRKTVASVPERIETGGKAAASSGPSSPSNSGKDPGSSSTSSPDSKNPGSVETPPAAAQFADLSEENEKLRRDNQMLSSELAQTKKHCDELVAFLTQRLKVAPDQINRIMRQGSSEPTRDWSVAELGATVDEDEDDDENGTETEEEEEGLKLFGVVLKSEKKKRGREENTEYDGAPRKELKIVGLLEQPIKACD